MSLIIRDQLTIAATRLVKEIDEAQSAYGLPIQESSLMALGMASERLRRSSATVQGLLDRWTGVIAGLVDELKEAEEKVFSDFRVGGICIFGPSGLGRISRK